MVQPWKRSSVKTCNSIVVCPALIRVAAYPWVTAFSQKQPAFADQALLGLFPEEIPGSEL